MKINQLLRGLLHEQGEDPRPFIAPSDPQSFERIVAALLTTEEEYRRITTPAIKGDGRILFFSGCNIYYQPNLLLTAMDILDLITHDWTYLPGLNHCCGSNYDSAGRLETGSKALEGLASAFRETDFETIVVWCSTCAVRFHQDGFDLPVISFARLAADRLGTLLAGKPVAGGVTIQEPCKDAYMSMDPQAPREVLKLVAGEPVREMIRHGRDTVCCGWALRQHQPKVWDESMKERMAEAEATGAQTLATVCHGCQWIMDRPGTDTNMKVVNYIRLVGKALGVSHRERFRELREMGSPEEAIDLLKGEMGGRFDRLPFDRDRIMEAVEILLEGFYGT
jgi:Fe-S oxidoreductase